MTDGAHAGGGACVIEAIRGPDDVESASQRDVAELLAARRLPDRQPTHPEARLFQACRNGQAELGELEHFMLLRHA